MPRSNKELSETEFIIADSIKRAMHALNCEKPLLAKEFLWRALKAVHR